MRKAEISPNWACIQRQRLIENLAWWKGIVNRQDLTDKYGISPAQASSDLQQYVDSNPDALIYSLRQKRYEAQSTMKCVLIQPKLQEAAAMLLADDYSSSVWGGATFCSAESLIGTVQFPSRESSDVIERRSVLAILNSLRVRVRYTGQQDGKKDWHWIRPHALGYNGVSWFLRSWCETYDQFQDFSLNRMLEIEWSKQHAPIPEPDTEWEEWTTLRLRANRGLSRPERQAVELDYGMTTGVLKIRVRKAMVEYQLARLGLANAGGTLLLESTR